MSITPFEHPGSLSGGGGRTSEDGAIGRPTSLRRPLSSTESSGGRCIRNSHHSPAIKIGAPAHSTPHPSRNSHAAAAPSPRSSSNRHCDPETTSGKPPSLTSLVVTATGFSMEQQAHIAKAVKAAGHRYTPELSTSVNVLVVNTGMTDSVKFVKATQIGLVTVTEKWVRGGCVPCPPEASASRPHHQTTSGVGEGPLSGPNYYPPCSLELINNRHCSKAVVVTQLTWATISTTSLTTSESSALGEAVASVLNVEITGSLTAHTKLLVVADTLAHTIPQHNNVPNTRPSSSAPPPPLYTGENLKVAFAAKRRIPIMSLSAFLKTYLPPDVINSFWRRVATLEGGGSALLPPSRRAAADSQAGSAATENSVVILCKSSLCPKEGGAAMHASDLEGRAHRACLELGLVRLPVEVLLPTSTGVNQCERTTGEARPPCRYVLVLEECPVPQPVLDALSPSTTPSSYATSIRGCNFVSHQWLLESHMQKKILSPAGISGSGGMGRRPFRWTPMYVTLCRIQSSTERREITTAAASLGAVVLNDLLLRAALPGGDVSCPVSTTHLVCGLDTVPAACGTGFALTKNAAVNQMSAKLTKVWSYSKKAKSWCSIVTPDWVLKSAQAGRWLEEEPFTVHPPQQPVAEPSTSTRQPAVASPSMKAGQKRPREEGNGISEATENTTNNPATSDAWACESGPHTAEKPIKQLLDTGVSPVIPAAEEEESEVEEVDPKVALRNALDLLFEGSSASPMKTSFDNNVTTAADPQLSQSFAALWATQHGGAESQISPAAGAFFTQMQHHLSDHQLSHRSPRKPASTAANGSHPHLAIDSQAVVYYEDEEAENRLFCPDKGAFGASSKIAAPHQLSGVLSEKNSTHMPLLSTIASASAVAGMGNASSSNAATTEHPTNNVPPAVQPPPPMSALSLATAPLYVLFIAKNAREQLPQNICTIIQDMGGEIATTADVCTHYVCLKPTKTETVLCCLAAGKWLLTPRYLEDLAQRHAQEITAGTLLLHSRSMSIGRASVNPSSSSANNPTLLGANRPIANLKEEGYEWCSNLIFSENSGGNSGSLSTSTSALADACPRQRRAASRCFSTWRVVLVCSAPQRVASFSKVLKSGGGTIVNSCTKDDLNDAVRFPADATHVLCEDGLVATSRNTIKAAVIRASLLGAPHFKGVLKMEFLVHALCAERPDPDAFREIDLQN